MVSAPAERVGPKGRTTQAVATRIKKTDAAKLQALAEGQDTTVSALLRRLLKQELAQAGID